MSLKQGLVLANAEGVIDSDYTEELMVLLHNISENSITINDGDRVAQAELVQNIEYVIEQTAVRPIPKTNRTGGFGSTGVATISQISNEKDIVVINIPETIQAEEKRGRGRPRKNATSSP
jgi:dUTP pyrophosphatase